jgi:hypothetical protein
LEPLVFGPGSPGAVCRKLFQTVSPDPSISIATKVDCNHNGRVVKRIFDTFLHCTMNGRLATATRNLFNVDVFSRNDMKGGNIWSFFTKMLYI